MTIAEIAPDLFRISTFIPEANLQFNQFVVRDEQPLLFHTGMRALFPLVRDAVEKVLNPATIRWIGCSHFEADECGALNEWLAVAPEAQPVCSRVGALVSLNDFASRLPRPMAQDEVLETGTYRFRFQRTPQVPHCWDAGLLFEETHKTLLCSDLFHQNGDVEAFTETDIVGRARAALTEYEASEFAGYMPYTDRTAGILHGLADLQPRTIAAMHGSTFRGDGARALRDLAAVMHETLAATAA